MKKTTYSINSEFPCYIIQQYCALTEQKLPKIFAIAHDEKYFKIFEQNLCYFCF